MTVHRSNDRASLGGGDLPGRADCGPPSRFEGEGRHPRNSVNRVNFPREAILFSAKRRAGFVTLDGAGPTPRSPGANERRKSKRLETPGFKLFSTPSALVHHSTYAKFEAEVGSSTPLVEPKGDRTWQSF